MANCDSFNRALFGGYRKKDVLQYISEAEQEREELRAKAQKEIEMLKGRAAVLEQEKEELLKQLDMLRQEKIEDVSEQCIDERDQFLDQDVLMTILGEARRTAQNIEDDARKNALDIVESAKAHAERIFAEAKKECESQKAVIKDKINDELDDKGIQLLAVKHKLTQYIEEIYNAQQHLLGLYNHMRKLNETMPGHLQDFWKEDEELSGKLS